MDSQTQYKQLILPELKSVLPSPKSFPGGAGPGRGKRKNTNDAVLSRWNIPGSVGFWSWVADIEPRILTRSNRYELFTPNRKDGIIIANCGRFTFIIKFGHKPSKDLGLSWSNFHISLPASPKRDST
jgi:hypothetical protein